MGAKKVKTPSHQKDEAPKYDPMAHVIIYASMTRPCLNCGRNSVHKERSCNQ